MLGAINTVIFCAFLVFGPSLPAVQYSRIDRIQVGPTPQGQCKMELAEELRIGLVNGPEEYAFTQIDALLVGAEGSIYVVDLHSQGIRQFDRNGQFVRWIGREGEGPGEFRSILGIGALSDGRFSIWDYGNRRITVYDSAGAYIEGIRVGAGAYTSRPFQVDTSGTYFLKVIEGQPGITSSGQLFVLNYAYLKISPAGRVLDTLSLPSETPPGSFIFGTVGGNLRPFTRHEVYALSPLGHLVVGSNAEYSFEIRDPQGSVTVQRDDFEPVEVGREELEEWRALASHNERMSGLSFDAIPDEKPAFRNLWVDSDGRIWVHRYVEAVKRDLPEVRRTRGAPAPNITWREPGLFDVYSKEGDFLWCAELPWNAKEHASQGSLVWGVIRGDFDEEYVVRWRLIPNGGGDPHISP